MPLGPEDHDDDIDNDIDNTDDTDGGGSELDQFEQGIDDAIDDSGSPDPEEE